MLDADSGAGSLGNTGVIQGPIPLVSPSGEYVHLRPRTLASIAKLDRGEAPPNTRHACSEASESSPSTFLVMSKGAKFDGNRGEYVFAGEQKGLPAN